MHTDELLTLAELTIALAGFTAIVVVLAKENDKRKSRWQLFGLTRGLLESCLATILFCLLPVVLSKFSLSTLEIWTWSCGIHAVFFGVWATLFSTLVFLAKLTESPDKRLEPFADMPLSVPLIMVPGMVAVCFLQSFNALGGFGGEPSAGLYFGILVLQFTVVFIVFIALLWSVLDDGTGT